MAGAETRINITEADNAMSKLRSLKMKCTSNQTNASDTVGGGQTVNEPDMGKMYFLINKRPEELIGYSSAFFINVMNCYVTGDQKAAKG